MALPLLGFIIFFAVFILSASIRILNEFYAPDRLSFGRAAAFLVGWSNDCRRRNSIQWHSC